MRLAQRRRRLRCTRLLADACFVSQLTYGDGGSSRRQFLQAGISHDKCTQFDRATVQSAYSVPTTHRASDLPIGTLQFCLGRKVSLAGAGLELFMGGDDLDAAIVTVGSEIRRLV